MLFLRVYQIHERGLGDTCSISLVTCFCHCLLYTCFNSDGTGSVILGRYQQLLTTWTRYFIGMALHHVFHYDFNSTAFVHDKTGTIRDCNMKNKSGVKKRKDRKVWVNRGVGEVFRAAHSHHPNICEYFPPPRPLSPTLNITNVF